MINDITTDPSAPVRLYKVVNGAVTDDLHPYPEPFAEVQRRKYPTLGPIKTDGKPEKVFSYLEQIFSERFQVVVASRQELRIQVVATTTILRFKDDIAAELRPVGKKIEVHFRSRSRIGKSDLGTNAKRIRSVQAAVRELLNRSVEEE